MDKRALEFLRGPYLLAFRWDGDELTGMSPEKEDRDTEEERSCEAIEVADGKVSYDGGC